MRNGHNLLILRLHHPCFKHGSVLLTEDGYYIFVGVERFTLDHKCNITQVRIIHQATYTFTKRRLTLEFKFSLWARICVKFVNILQIVLAIATSNDVEFGANKGH